MTIPALFLLPQGLTITGVNSWALALAYGLRSHNIHAEIIAHGSASGHTPIDTPIPQGVPLHAPDLPDIESLNGDVWPMVDAYRPFIDRLWDRFGSPVMLIPTRHGDCFGACAALASIIPDRVRVIGWRHAPLGYETAVLKHYEPIIAAYAGVSTHLASDLARALHGRDVSPIPNAIQTTELTPTRNDNAGPIRLISTGRLDQPTKRVGALIAMSDALNAREIEHHLTILGDGPQRRHLEHLAQARDSVTIAEPCAPEAVRAHLDASDVFVLASRVEGMSMSALEAMERGCACVLTRTPSGAIDLIPDADHGVLVPRLDDANDLELGDALADGIQTAIRRGIQRLGTNARRRAEHAFAPEIQAKATHGLFERATDAQPRRWPSDRGFSFSAASGASGSTPADAADRMAAALAQHRGQPIAIHGTGRHTADLIRVIESSPAPIAAFIDDDPTRWGTRFAGMPVTSPDQAKTLGIEAVILSSWMHEAELYARRSIYERHGIRVVRLYPPIATHTKRRHSEPDSAAA